MKTAIIAEKPSVAREIANIVGAKTKEDGFISGNGYMVTWALGHLVQLGMPEDYGIAGFNREHLPIIPGTFILKPRHIKDGKEYKPDAGALKQLNIIKKVFEECDRIIVATDAGREGCLIFRYIYHYLNCRKPFERLWISSLTNKAIREGLQNLKAGSSYDNLYHAAKARSESDWLVGINASQSLSIAAGRGVFSLGRVQTPTLVMICKRFLENKHFVSVPFWQVSVQTGKSDVPFSALSKEKYEQEGKANEVLRLLQDGKTITVKSVERKEVNQEPPLLYDLTTLQKEANSKHGFSADKTLSIAQKLYEAKLITYPRTGSRYISVDVFDEIPQLIKNLENHPRFGDYARKMEDSALNIRSVDDKKVTDHHALLITENPVKNISDDDKTIYEMIAGRMLEAFSKKCVKDATTITLTCGDTVFETRGSVVKHAGWRNVFGEQEETNEDEAGNLPNVQEGEQLPVVRAEAMKKQTKPKPLHTEASLLSAMEMPCQRGLSERSSTMPSAAGIGGTQSAGKEVENEEERAAIKESGIGTPATRAAIIETLFARDYIRREKKSLVPTEKGLSVYDVVKDKRIADVAMTGNWENALSKIESGEMDTDTFRQAIEVYTRQITAELLNTSIAIADNNTCDCPKCQTGKVVIYPKVAKCTDANCGLIVFRSISDKQLSDNQITDLLTKGKTTLIKGFRSKTGKIFEATLKFDENWRVVFDFPEKKRK